jgi:hypothetical protein
VALVRAAMLASSCWRHRLLLDSRIGASVSALVEAGRLGSPEVGLGKGNTAAAVSSP